MNDFVFIEGLKVHAIIGIHPQERVKKQPVLLDIKLQTDISNAVLTEDIGFCVDYQAISEDLINYLSKSSFQLIETLAENCAQRVLTHPLVSSIELKVSKPQALDTCKNVGLVIFRKK